MKPQPSLDDRGPTQERLKQADAFERGRDGRGRETGRVTILGPLERLAKGKKPVITGNQYNALYKFRHHWYHAGQAGHLSAIDPNRIFARDETNFSNMAKTESEAFHREQYREASRELGLRLSFVVEMGICREKSLADVGRSLGFNNEPQARAAATVMLLEAADRLHALWRT